MQKRQWEWALRLTWKLQENTAFSGQMMEGRWMIKQQKAPGHIGAGL